MAINTITGNTMLISGSFPPVRAATTGANINLQTIALRVIDGVQLVARDRVLVKDQTDGNTHGIYSAHIAAGRGAPPAGSGRARGRPGPRAEGTSVRPIPAGAAGSRPRGAPDSAPGPGSSTAGNGGPSAAGPAKPTRAGGPSAPPAGS